MSALLSLTSPRTRSGSLELVLEMLYRVANAQDSLGVFVGSRRQTLLQSHNQLDRVQRIALVFAETGFRVTCSSSTPTDQRYLLERSKVDTAGLLVFQFTWCRIYAVAVQRQNATGRTPFWR